MTNQTKWKQNTRETPSVETHKHNDFRRTLTRYVNIEIVETVVIINHSQETLLGTMIHGSGLRCLTRREK